MNKKVYILRLVSLLMLMVSPCIRAQESILLEDDFQSFSEDWKHLILEGEDTANVEFALNSLSIAPSDDEWSGLYNTREINGHFQIEVYYKADDNIMVALFHQKDDKGIDRENYSALCIDQVDGKAKVYLTDMQDGIPNVLDNSNQVAASDYEHILDSSVFSLPFNGTAGTLRIFYNSLSKFFHFYYKVSANIQGEEKQDWIELFPSRKWGSPDAYYVGLLANGDSANYSKITVKNLPFEDQSDLTSGFQAVERNYTWSGYSGNAVVVSFDNNFPYRDKDYKFVFWDQANYVPAWHLSNDLHYTYEFVETWDGGYEGCHEPMSDRLLRWSNVEIIEDNAVRKVIHWHYALINPDYNYPNDWDGTEIPEVDEYYYIYPDGQIVRSIYYFPKLDSDFRNWHELTELIIIAGVQSQPSEHLSSPALSVTDLKYKQEDFHSTSDGGSFHSDDWESYICATHFKKHPDALNAFIQEEEDGKQMFFEVSWHNTEYKFTHWPVNKVVYKEACKTYTPWRGMVSHTSLIGGGVSSGTAWNSNYELSDSRKYRQWSSLMFLSEARNVLAAQQTTRGWKNPGAIEMIQNTDVSFDEYLREEKCLVFSNSSGQSKDFSFEVKSEKAAEDIVLRVKSWGRKAVSVKLNGNAQRSKHWVYDNDDLLLWIPGAYEGTASIEVIASDHDFTAAKGINYSPDIDMYPNPTREKIHLDFQGRRNPDSIQLFNASGTLLKNIIDIKQHIAVNLADMPAGVYHLKFNYAENQSIKRFIVLE